MLPLLGLVWLAGIAVVALWGAPWWLFAFIAAFAAAIRAARQRTGRGMLVVAAVMVCAGLGAWRFAGWEHRGAPALGAYVGSQVTLEGRIASLPDPGETTVRYRVDVARLATAAEPDGRTLGGAVLVTLEQYAEHAIGERVRVRGRLDRPPAFADFDYRAYLERKGIQGTLLRPRVERLDEPGPWEWRRPLGAARLRLERALAKALPEPEASLGAGIVLGRDENLPRPLYDDFRSAGIAHIVAVSGANIALVTALTFLILVRVIPRRRATLPAGGMVLLYVFAAGASPSAVRAGVMACVMLGGMATGRQRAALPALALAVMAMTLLDPAAARDIGFQLSVAATAGLVVFSPWLAAWLQRLCRRVGIERIVPGTAVQGIAMTSAATAATLPLIWVNFGQVSLIGLPANLAVAPIFALAFGLSGAAAVAGALWEPAGWAIGLAAYYPLAFMTAFARTAADVPGAAVSVPQLGGDCAAAAYALLLLAGWFAYRRMPDVTSPTRPVRLHPALRFASAAAGGIALGLLVWRVSLAPLAGPGRLRIDVLDVGQGDAVLITTPHGLTTLIDGGPSGIAAARGLGAVLPHWDRSIDRTVLTHPQEDHTAGLVEVLDRFDVGQQADTGATNTTATFGRYRAGAVERRELRRGDAWEEDGVRFEVLWPPDGYRTRDLNNTSIILRVSYGQASFLFTGDSESPAQNLLLRQDDVRATVLKLPHHGSKTSSTAFLKAVEPQATLVSVGAANRFGHPAPEVLRTLAGSAIYRTDLQGRITVWTDGRRVRVETER